MKKIIFFVALIANLSGEDLEKIFITGQEASKLLLKTLGGEMKKQIENGDIVKAVQFCSQNAYTITEQVDKQLGENISIKRISTKNRNPINQPTQEEAKLLFMLENSKTPILTKVGDTQYKFYQPIRIGQPVCLKCHGKGEDMPEAVRKITHELYPQDKATGYNFGDLRGAVVVTITK